MVKHGGTHAHQGSVLYLTSMQGDAVSYGHIIAQYAWCFAIQCVDAAVVLHIGSVAYLDEVHISTYYCIEPYGTVVSHLYVSHYHGSLAEVAMFAESWRRHSCQSFDYSHIFITILYNMLFCSFDEPVQVLSAEQRSQFLAHPSMILIEISNLILLHHVPQDRFHVDRA